MALTGDEAGLWTGVAWVGPAGRRLDLPCVGEGAGGVVAQAVALRRARVSVAFLDALAAGFPALALACTLGGVSAVVGVLDRAPPGTGVPGGRWHRRVHRFVAADQEVARVWGRAGIALGRIVVVPAGAHEREGLEAVLREVRAMAR